MFRLPNWTRRRHAIERDDGPRPRESASVAADGASRVLSYSNLPPGESGVAVESTSDFVRVIVPSTPLTLAESGLAPAIAAIVGFAMIPAAAMYLLRRDLVLFGLLLLIIAMALVSLLPPIVRFGRLTSVELIINRDWVIRKTRRFGRERIKRWRARSVRDAEVREIVRGNQFVTRVSAGQLKLRRYGWPTLRLVTLETYDEAEDIADHICRLLELPRPGLFQCLFTSKASMKMKSPELPESDRV